MMATFLLRLPAIRLVRPRALPWRPSMPQASGGCEVFIDSRAFEAVKTTPPPDVFEPARRERGKRVVELMERWPR